MEMKGYKFIIPKLNPFIHIGVSSLEKSKNFAVQHFLL